MWIVWARASFGGGGTGDGTEGGHTGQFGPSSLSCLLAMRTITEALIAQEEVFGIHSFLPSGSYLKMETKDDALVV